MIIFHQKNIKLIHDIGVPSTKFFEQEVEKYCYMWREGGQFSTKKYNPTNS